MNICTQLFDFIWCRCSRSFLQHFFSAISLLFIGKLPVIVLPAGASTASVFIPIFSLHNFNSIAKMLQFFPLALYCSYLLACTMHFWFSPFDGKFMRCIRLILRCECVFVCVCAFVGCCCYFDFHRKSFKLRLYRFSLYHLHIPRAGGSFNEQWNFNSLTKLPQIVHLFPILWRTFAWWMQFIRLFYEMNGETPNLLANLQSLEHLIEWIICWMEPKIKFLLNANWEQNDVFWLMRCKVRPLNQQNQIYISSSWQLLIGVESLLLLLDSSWIGAHVKHSIVSKYLIS